MLEAPGAILKAHGAVLQAPSAILEARGATLCGCAPASVGTVIIPRHACEPKRFVFFVKSVFPVVSFLL